LIAGVVVPVANTLFRPTDGGYLVTFVDQAMEFAAERLHWKGDELHGHLAVLCGLAGARTVADGLVSGSTFNFSSSRARRERAKEIAERVRASKIDFIAMLEEVCLRVIRAERRGQPAVVLRDVPKRTSDQEHVVADYCCSRTQATINFGDGGVLKSTHGLYTIGCLEQRGVRTALFDWEQDEDAQRGRLEQLFGTDMPDVRYVRCDRPLIYEVDRLKKIVRDDRLEFALFDSVAYACAGPPEAAEHAMAYFRAVRQLGIGSLHIAHVRQGEGNDQRPFGSSFWHNSARATWFVKLAATSTDSQRLRIGLFNRKSNLTALRPAVGFEVSFEHTRTRFERIAVAEVQELADSLPLWQRMKQAIRHAPKTLARLADELGASVETLDRTVRRKNGLFTRIPGPEGITQIALVERQAS
jgi:hypothetical protein